MKNLVNKRSGRILAEFAEGTYSTICDAVVGEQYKLDNDTMTVYIADAWHDYFDLATEREMSYREYKTNYSDCDTKKKSYNGETKTIVVYVQDDDQRATVNDLRK